MFRNTLSDTGDFGASTVARISSSQYSMKLRFIGRPFEKTKYVSDVLRSGFECDLSAKLQACCINFNDAIKTWFGSQYGLERRLPIALQFVTFGDDQRSILKKTSGLPGHIEAAINTFEEALSDEQYRDPAYRYRVAFVPVIKQRASAADLAVEFVKSGSEEADEINRILLKEVERNRFTPTQVVRLMNENGFPGFTQNDHTRLWRELDAKNPANGFGREGDYRNTWVWYDRWVERVRAHCEEQGERYQ